jgi:hypothetical protein
VLQVSDWNRERIDIAMKFRVWFYSRPEQGSSGRRLSAALRPSERQRAMDKFNGLKALPALWPELTIFWRYLARP